MTSFSLALSRRFLLRPLAFAATLTALWAPAQVQPASGRVVVETRSAQASPGIQDAGPAPGSQRLSLVVTLAPSSGRTAALDQLLAAQLTAGSPSFHHWLTPDTFAAQFGATPEQLAGVKSWAQAQELNVDAVSPSAMRVTISGSVAQVQAALAVSVRQYQVAGSLYFANSTQPSVPGELGDTIADIEGLNSMPPAAGSMAALSATAREAGSATATQAADFESLAALIDRNGTSEVSITSGLCAADVSTTQSAAYTALFRQANAQGMTVFAGQGCAAGAFPASLAEVTSVSLTGSSVASTGTPLTPRPLWQIAPGLPADGSRYAPDLTVSSVAALAQTIAGVIAHTGSRQGNINSVLYELATTPGLYTQPDGAAAGTWEPATGLGLVDLPMLGKVFPQGTGGAGVQVQPSSGTLVHGSAFTLTATVNSLNGGPTPSGTITFSSTQAGFTSSSTGLNASGVAISQSELLPGGTYTVTATYSGDTNYAQAQGTTTFTIQPEAASFNLTASPSVALGGNIALTASLASSSGFGTPTGSVTVTPNGLSNQSAVTQTLAGSNGTATAAYSFTANAAGTISFQASCTPGDQSFTCYSQPTATTTVPQANPSVLLTSNNSNPTVGAAVTYTATVTGVTGVTPTGQIQFMNGSTVLGAGTPPTAAVTTSSLPTGSQTITAVYSGDKNYVKLTSNPLTPTVGTASTTTTIALAAATYVYGTNSNLTVTIAPSTTVAGAQPTGTLTFAGLPGITTVTVNSTMTTVQLVGVAAGTYSITSTYSGDQNYAGSTSAAVTLVVAPTVATLAVNNSSTTFTNGSTDTLTVTAQLPGNAMIPAGTTFTATVVGTTATYSSAFTLGATGNNGTAQVTINAPPAGSYTVQITCSANTSFTCPATSFNITSTATTTIGTTGTTATTTKLTSSSASPAAGASVTLTATVSAGSATATTSAISGSVAFYDGTKLLGSSPVTASGTSAVATLVVTLSGATSHSLTAVYSGDTVYMTSTSTAVPVTTSATPATINLAASSTSGLAGSLVTFTATVTGSTATGTAPSGSVSFYLVGTPTLLATVGLTSGGAGVGVATYTTTGFPAGSQTVYAVYSGDTNFASATSNSITLGFSDYNLTFLPQSLTITRGQSAQTTLILGIINGFTGTVVFGCTPPPNTEMTCSFSPTTLTGGGSTTMTITSTAPKTQAIGAPGQHAGLRGNPGAGIAGGLSLAGLLCLLLPGRARRRLPAMLLVLLALGMTVSLGCSNGTFYGTSNSVTDAGTPLGTVIFTVNTAGTNGTTTVKHNYSYQVTVQ